MELDSVLSAWGKNFPVPPFIGVIRVFPFLRPPETKFDILHLTTNFFFLLVFFPDTNLPLFCAFEKEVIPHSFWKNLMTSPSLFPLPFLYNIVSDNALMKSQRLSRGTPRFFFYNNSGGTHFYSAFSSTQVNQSFFSTLWLVNLPIFLAALISRTLTLPKMT